MTDFAIRPSSKRGVCNEPARNGANLTGKVYRAYLMAPGIAPGKLSGSTLLAPGTPSKSQFYYRQTQTGQPYAIMT